MKWDEKCHEASYKTYRAISDLCIEHVPNFTVIDFARLRPDLWKRICKIERDIDHPNTTPTGIKAGFEQLLVVWGTLVDCAKKENDKLRAHGIPIESVSTGVQLYREEKDLFCGSLISEDIRLAGLMAYFNNEMCLADAFAVSTGPIVRGLSIVDDGTVKASKGKKKRKSAGFTVPEEAGKVDWEPREASTEMPEIEGFEEADQFQVEELDLSGTPQIVQELDFDIVEVFED